VVKGGEERGGEGRDSAWSNSHDESHQGSGEQVLTGVLLVTFLSSTPGAPILTVLCKLKLVLSKSKT
jgi:hypothetical protein